MSATFQIKTVVQRGGKIEINTAELPEGTEVTVTVERADTPPDYIYDPLADPIAPFIGAFDSGDAPPLQAGEEDQYYIGKAPHAQQP